MEIEGEKITLRPMEIGNLDLVYTWVNDPEVAGFWYGKDKPRTKEWILKHFSPAIKGEKDYNYWIIEMEGRPIGYADTIPGHNDDDEFTGVVEIDILIGDKNKWGSGYGTDALKTLQKYAFETLGAERVFLVPRTTNPRAIHVYEKVGFRQEGVLRHNEKFEGKWVDGVMMSILRDEYYG